MASFDDWPPFGRPAPGNADWDDWDPTRARTGYTGHVRALRDLDLLRASTSPAPTPLPPAPGPAGALTPAGVSALERLRTADYLTATWDLHDPGFVEVYDTVIVPEWSTPFGRLLLSVFLTLPRDPAWQLLDVACGTGYPTLELARFLGKDSDIAGIDPWEEAIHLARRKASAEWLRNVTFLAGDLGTTRLPDRSFDVITCNLGLSSFPDPASALSAMWRLLRPQGHLLLTFPAQAAMREFLDSYYLTLRDLRLGDFMTSFSRQVAARPTIESVRALAERAGFDVRRVATDNFILRYADARSFLQSPVVQTVHLAAWREIVPDLTLRRLVFNEVDRRLTARAQANGGTLSMTVPMICLSAIRL